jgi:hypothetical protein
VKEEEVVTVREKEFNFTRQIRLFKYFIRYFSKGNRNTFANNHSKYMLMIEALHSISGLKLAFTYKTQRSLFDSVRNPSQSGTAVESLRRQGISWQNSVFILINSGGWGLGFPCFLSHFMSFLL